MREFETAHGSMIGRDHRLANRNNQDAHHLIRIEDALIAVVSDGCGSGVSSEVGARMGSRLIAEHLHRAQKESGTAFPNLDVVREEVLASLTQIANLFNGRRSEFVNDYLLFTCVVAYVTSHLAIFATIGDGYLEVNGNAIPLGPFPDNAPPYIAYGLARTSLDPELLKFRIHLTMPTDELNSFVIGTDGLCDYARVCDENVPGKDERVGPVSRFYEEDRFFRNPDMVRRRLTLVGRDASSETGVQHGLLPDDTTLIVGRRKVTHE